MSAGAVVDRHSCVDYRQDVDNVPAQPLQHVGHHEVIEKQLGELGQGRLEPGVINHWRDPASAHSTLPGALSPPRRLPANSRGLLREAPM
jgi:hypothetical protein